MSTDVGVEPHQPADADETASASPIWLSERAARWAFVAVELGALVFYFVLARSQWFFLDEWFVIAGRGMGDLMRPHGGHWIALPIVSYRVLWWAVGLRSYLPYVGITIGLHLTAAALLRVVMRRAGVGPWIATVCASVFVLFGSGVQDILWAFQIAFGGALVFGLAHLLLADHSGAIDRRDFVGLGAGLLGIMCSGVAIAMVVVVGCSVLMRRGWRVAALHTTPLAVVFVGWWLRYGRVKTITGSFSDVTHWTRSGATGVFDALGRQSGIAWILGLTLIAGLGIAIRESGWRVLRERAAPTLALLVGALCFLVLTGAQRSAIVPNGAREGRYEHIIAALVLPALGLAASALSRRWRAVGAVAVVALLVGIPGNIGESTRFARTNKPISERTRLLMLSIPRMKLAAEVPSSLRPDPVSAPDVTVGWLRDGVASGRIPAPHGAIPRLKNTLRLSLMELDRPSGDPCTVLGSPRLLSLKKGDSFGVRGSVDVAMLTDRNGTSKLALGTRFPNVAPFHTLVAVAGPLRIRIAGSFLGTSLICLPEGFSGG